MRLLTLRCSNRLTWQVDRYKKILSVEKAGDMKYAGMYCNFEIFHMLEKQIPVDSVEVNLSTTINEFRCFSIVTFCIILSFILLVIFPSKVIKWLIFLNWGRKVYNTPNVFIDFSLNSLLKKWFVSFPYSSLLALKSFHFLIFSTPGEGVSPCIFLGTSRIKVCSNSWRIPILQCILLWTQGRFSIA